MGVDDLLITKLRSIRIKLVGILLLTSMLVTGCSLVSEPEDRSLTSPTVDAVPTLPSMSSFELVDAEKHRKIKQSGVSFLEAILNYKDGDQGFDSAQQRAKRQGVSAYDVQALEDLKPLISSSDATSTSIVYPQLGGLTENEGALIVVLEVTRQSGTKLRTSTLTLDVRMKLFDGIWKVSRIKGTDNLAETETGHSASPGASPGYETLSQDERDFVSAQDIDLPDSAISDILTGDIQPLPLKISNEFAKNYKISVAVLRTGHPRNVFATERVSNHTRGRAIDVWEIDGVAIAELATRPKENNPAYELMSLALEMGADEVGGPWRIATQFGATFSNEVHQDHIHIGVEPK